MFKSKSNILLILWKLADSIALFVLFYFGYLIRFNLFDINFTIPPFKSYFIKILFLIAIWQIYAHLFKLYVSKRIISIYSDWKPIILATIFTIPTYAAIGFIFKSLDISRLMLLQAGLISIVVIGLYHQLVRYYLNIIRRKGYNQRSMLIVGAGEIGKEFVSRILYHSEFGYKIIGFLDDTVKKVELWGREFPVLGPLDHADVILRGNTVDRVVIGLPITCYDRIKEISHICEYEGIEVNIIPDFFRFINTKTKVQDVDGMPLIGLRSNPVDNIKYIYYKRFFDIVFSFFALVLLSPVILGFGIAVKIVSSGPMFFKQKRIGANGKAFNFYKLRTMKVAPEEETDTVWTTEDDPRRFKLGAFMRRFSIDELPQFWNVLKGDMSIVGPRPERPHFAREFQKEYPKYMVRHQVKTGITGWAQVNGYRGDTSIQKRIDHDLYYIENWTFSLDLKIILRTIFHTIHGKNAY